MNMLAHRQKFAHLVSLPDEEVDLIEAALLIAAEDEEISNLERYYNLIKRLANRYEANYNLGIPLEWSVARLTEFIHREEGFEGNVRNYYAPENSYLNRVLETRQGIPITLALIHIGIGQELNIPVGGINFPGHFLVKYGNEDEIIVDPFSGRILSETDCRTLFKQVNGPRAELNLKDLERSANKDILSRILDNLKNIFWRNRHWNEVLSCIERQMLINPGTDELLLQKSAVLEAKGDLVEALRLYFHLLEHSRDERILDAAGKRVLVLSPSPRIKH